LFLTSSHSAPLNSSSNQFGKFPLLPIFQSTNPTHKPSNRGKIHRIKPQCTGSFLNLPNISQRSLKIPCSSDRDKLLTNLNCFQCPVSITPPCSLEVFKCLIKSTSISRNPYPKTGKSGFTLFQDTQPFPSHPIQVGKCERCG